MKTIIAASLIASATAFAPSSIKQSSSAFQAFENELGAQAPLGYWDPLGLSADGDQAKFDQYRAAELKHGRVAQLAL
jgi:hypothetical protein